MHCRVLLSQCTNPIPNLKRHPKKAISSVVICPVLEKGYRLRAMFGPNLLESLAEKQQRPLPIARLKGATPVRSHKRRGAAIGCGQWRKSFPSFGTRHSKVDRVVGIRTEIDRLTVPHVNVQPASC